MPEKPLVSAVITTHDRPNLLRRALASVQRQTYSNLEVIVVDDGSQRAVESIVAEFENEIDTLIYHRNERPMGACAARNQGIERSTGTFVAGLDDDDEWMPERIEKMLSAYDDSFAFVTSDVIHVAKNITNVWRKPRVITLERLLYSNQIGNQGLIKRERLLAVGGFDESLRAAQDYDLWVRLSLKFGPVRNVQYPLQKVYLKHEGEQITSPKNQLSGYLDFYNKHKHLMNRLQRKYQLFAIMKATGKADQLSALLKWVPPKYLWKELKVYFLRKFT